MMLERVISALRYQSLHRVWAAVGALCLPILLSAQPLSYTVSWLGVPVVDVTIAVTENDSNYHAEYHAKTRPWFESIYSVDNWYRIWVYPADGYPIRYEKQIVERGSVDSLWARYEQNPGRVVYANGLERPLREGSHSLFSGLLWILQYPWVAGDERVLQVEVEGVIWQATVTCSAADAPSEQGDSLVEMWARFDEKLYGEPVLSTTDILTHMLPGKGHRLHFSLNRRRNCVEWIEFGTVPFQVRAELNSVPEQP